jgi:hypothetical protein
VRRRGVTLQVAQELPARSFTIAQHVVEDDEIRRHLLHPLDVERGAAERDAVALVLEDFAEQLQDGGGVVAREDVEILSSRAHRRLHPEWR